MNKIKDLFKKIKNSRILKKQWIIKIIPQNPTSIFNLKISASHIIIGLVVLMILVGALFATANRKVIAKDFQVKKQKAQIKELSRLLDKQNKELAGELNKIQQDNNKIKTIVGLKPQKTTKPLKSKITSSRTLTPVQLHERVKYLQNSIKATIVEQKKLKQKAIKYRKNIERQRMVKQLEAIPSRWPVAGGYISSGFGWRSHPVYGGMSFHEGIDIITSYGAPIYATMTGVVTFSGYEGGYGYVAKITSRDNWQTRYAHCSNLVVSEAQTVKKGQLIAYVGCTGTATGAHVHYEVARDGKLLDPQAYLNTENRYFAKISRKLENLQ